MGGKGHRWATEGKWKKAKHKTPQHDVSALMKKITNSAGVGGRSEEGGKVSEKEKKEWEQKKEEHSEQLETIAEEGKREQERKLKEAKDKAEFERTRMARAQEIMRGLRPGRVDNGFYGHVVASDFKRTSIVRTTGRVR
jgi:hypothetical protein